MGPRPELPAVLGLTVSGGLGKRPGWGYFRDAIMAKIVIRYQNQILGEAQLRPGFNTIGRLPAHPICIENLGISRNHAFIIGDIEEKIFILEDLQSLNGTYVNKKRVHKCLLKSNDVITIGQHALEYLEDAPRPREVPAQAPARPGPRTLPGSDRDRKVHPARSKKPPTSATAAATTSTSPAS